MTIAPGVLYPSVVLVDLVNTAFLASKEKVQPGPDPTVAIPPALAMSIRTRAREADDHCILIRATLTSFCVLH